MELLTLKRVSHTAEGTCGVLLFNQFPIIVTLENPWLENIRSFSCIPPGQYVCKPYSSNRFPITFQVMDVPKRSCIIFHKGNTIEDTRGCILTGSKFGTLKNKLAVLESRRAFKIFTELVSSWDSFLLNVLWS